MLFGISLPVVGNGEGFLPGHSRVPEAFKGRGANCAKVASRVAGANHRSSAKEAFYHVLLQGPTQKWPKEGVLRPKIAQGGVF